jgi:hypothetical protein
VHFEDMIRDLGPVCDQVGALLGCTLTADEKARVLDKCSFEYMKQHEDWFEMAPPTMFSVNGGRFLAVGRDRPAGTLPPETRDRIVSYCRAEIAAGTYPAARFYPDLAP